ncbi:hypothetical protein [Alteromonas gilva]|uniref:TonB-dependent receptor n=1 Tax=Alteromonas gilva TaxID=2987522 RepID=A0ABT5L0K5_9ALTE|nr:hypothetical protein [Alteromonas gilva]MDC8830569.1 hypothetical protein [Alteromonas gilva]
MKKQLTLIAGLIALSWAGQTMATETQALQLKPVNTMVMPLEILLEQPVIDVSTSIREQANSNLQTPNAVDTVLLVREDRLRTNQERSPRAE